MGVSYGRLAFDFSTLHIAAVPDFNPATVIVAELIARLNERAFTAFTIVLSDGSRHEVPSREHCTVTRLLRRVEVESDDGSIANINPLHVTRLELKHQPAA